MQATESTVWPTSKPTLLVSSHYANIGFEPFSSDLCLFKHSKHEIYIILYVDDLLISAPSVDDINRIRDKLRHKYKLKKMGEVKRFLGFDVVRDRKAKTIFLSQEAYTLVTCLKSSNTSMFNVFGDSNPLAF